MPKIPELKRPLCDGAMPVSDYTRLGWFWAHRIRIRAQAAGVHQAARNLRKQGVPLRVALLILGRRRPSRKTGV